MLLKDALIKNILAKLSLLELYVKNINAISFFDSNLVAEDFFASFLSILNNSKFVNANLFEKNYASIDLINTTDKIAIQVTSENTSTKIKKTINKFIDNKYYEQYKELKILLLKKKKDYSAIFDTKDLFEFQILDFEDLANEVRNLDVEALKKLNSCVEQNIEIDAFNKTNFAMSMAIYTEDIKNIIDVFCDYKKEIVKSLDPRTNYNKYPGINEKNVINNLGEEYFSNSILRDMPEFKIIDDFLENPRNEEYLDKYYDISTDIKNKLIVHNSKYDNFESAISIVHDIVIANENIKNKRLVYLLLHYMYCKCDIGKNVNA